MCTCASINLWNSLCCDSKWADRNISDSVLPHWSNQAGAWTNNLRTLLKKLARSEEVTEEKAGRAKVDKWWETPREPVAYYRLPIGTKVCRGSKEGGEGNKIVFINIGYLPDTVLRANILLAVSPVWFILVVFEWCWDYSAVVPTIGLCRRKREIAESHLEKPACHEHSWWKSPVFHPARGAGVIYLTTNEETFTYQVRRTHWLCYLI